MTQCTIKNIRCILIFKAVDELKNIPEFYFSLLHIAIAFVEPLYMILIEFRSHYFNYLFVFIAMNAFAFSFGRKKKIYRQKNCYSNFNAVLLFSVSMSKISMDTPVNHTELVLTKQQHTEKKNAHKFYFN